MANLPKITGNCQERGTFSSQDGSDAQDFGDALDCLMCLDRCLEKVFATYPRNRREPGVATGDYVIIAAAILIKST